MEELLLSEESASISHIPCLSLTAVGHLPTWMATLLETSGLKHLWCVYHKTGSGTPAFTIQGATPHPVRTPRPTLQSMKKKTDPVWGLLHLSS